MNVQGKASETPDAARPSNANRVSIVGAATLKGKEVAEILGDRNFPSLDIKLLDDDESIGQLEAAGDEVSFIQRVRAEQYEQKEITSRANCSARTLKNWQAD